MVRVGLIGCGTIGTQLALAIERRYPHMARLVALHDVQRESARVLQRALESRTRLLSLHSLIRHSDLVLEAASPDIVSEVVMSSLRANRDVLVMSVGGLLRNRKWQRVAQGSAGRLWIPSGALVGLDAVKALAIGSLNRVSLTTRKPPQALISSPYVRRRRIPIERLRRACVLFEGSPEQVVKSFPQNTNIAAALVLALNGHLASRRLSSLSVRIRVIADPTIQTNIHELDVEGDCGRIQCRVESKPSKNPKTSEIAVRSAIATLKRCFETVQVGT